MESVGIYRRLWESRKAVGTERATPKLAFNSDQQWSMFEHNNPHTQWKGKQIQRVLVYSLDLRHHWVGCGLSDFGYSDEQEKQECDTRDDTE